MYAAFFKESRTSFPTPLGLTGNPEEAEGSAVRLDGETEPGGDSPMANLLMLESETADPSAPNDKPETGALSAAYPTQAQRQGLNGAPQPSLPVQEAGHCSLNLPQASWLLGMTNLRAVSHLGMVGGVDGQNTLLQQPT
jgi:hypothetical protein